MVRDNSRRHDVSPKLAQTYLCPFPKQDHYQGLRNLWCIVDGVLVLEGTCEAFLKIFI